MWKPEENGEAVLDFSSGFRHTGAMQCELRRLGTLVTNRRVARGKHIRKQFAESLGLSDRLLADIEKGVRTASAGTYAVLENHLSWKPGSIRAVLAGGNPTDLPSGAPTELRPEQSTHWADKLRVVPLDALLQEIKRRVLVAEEAQAVRFWEQGTEDSESQQILGSRDYPSQGR